MEKMHNDTIHIDENSSYKEKATFYLNLISDEVDQKMVSLGLYHLVNDKLEPTLGSCHVRWGIEKEILKERYDFDWKTPSEEHPEINFD